MAAFLLLAGMVVVGYMIFHNIFVKGAVCKSNVKLHGKTVIVTGEPVFVCFLCFPSLTGGKLMSLLCNNVE